MGKVQKSERGGSGGLGAGPESGVPTHYVAVGASAGGLEAIEAFFSRMPADNAFGFIVVQHLSPDYKSLMVEILSKKTSMPVQRAEEGMRVRAGNIYLIPPRKNLTIFHGTLMLSEQDINRGINLPIDVFLRSLAEDQGEKSVAVILSGSGSDGMRGVRSVKQAGGMIMVQEEASARFDSMPRAAVSTGLADFILPPGEMPEQLLAFTQHPYVARVRANDPVLADDDALTRIFALLRERSGVDFTYYKPSTVIRRIERRIGVTRTEDIDAYVKYMQEQPAEVTTLFRELLIGVTSFFRDPAVFEKLRDEVIPELLGTAGSGELRFWVAGCSTGEEAYTLAILCQETLTRLDVSHTVKIFATDIDRDAIRFAANGRYPESIAADIPATYLTRYFVRQDDHFQISRAIREMVVFAQHNLIKDPPFTRMDMVSCRNLLIYLQPVLQHRVLEYFSFSLHRGGILLLGTSETVGEMDDHYEVLDSPLKLYRSRGRTLVRRDSPPDEREPARYIAGGAGDTRFRELQLRYGGARRHIAAMDERILERFLEVAGEHFLPTAAIVNEQLQILHIVGESDRYFRLPSGRPTVDIGRMVIRELAIPLTTGVQKVFRQRKELLYSGIRYSRGDDRFVVDLRIVPLPELKGQDPLTAVFFLDPERDRGSGTAAVAGATTDTYDASREAQQRIVDLEQELQYTRENLQATVEELETSNEELQATNEELLASNEELQSTNEELHSTNEELYTVNTEYQNRIMELTELTNDVDNLLASSGIATLLLDENLEVRRFSPSLTAIFRIGSGDAERPISHIAHRLVRTDFLATVENVRSENRVVEKDVQTEDGTWFLMRVLPYSVAPDVYSGIVATFVDISGLRETQKLFETVADTSPALIWMAGRDKLCTWFNRPWLEFTGRSMEEEQGNGWTEGVHPEDYDRCLETYTKAFDRRERFTMEYRLRRKDGEYRWLLDEGQPRFGVAGDFDGYIGSCLDVTDLKQAQAKLAGIVAKNRDSIDPDGNDE